MGLLDGVHKFFSGLGGVGENLAMIPVDLATAPWSNDDSQNGTAFTVFAKTLEKRVGGAASDLLGPTGAVGTAIGGLPEGVRRPGRDIVQPVMGALNDIYTYGISQPIATAEIAGAGMLAGQGGGMQSLANAYGAAKYGLPGVTGSMGKGVSPGQGLAMLTHGENPWNANEMEKFQGTGYFKAVSGLADAVSRLTLDPTVLATEGLSELKDVGLATEAAKTATEQLGTVQKVSKTLEAAQPGRLAVKGALGLMGEDNVARLQQAFQAPKVNRFLSAVSDIADKAGPDGAAGAIRDKLLPDHPMGAAIAATLADAAGRDPGVLGKVFKSMTGDADATASLLDGHADLVGEINRLKVDEADLNNQLQASLVGPPPTPGQQNMFSPQIKAAHDEAWGKLQDVQAELKARYADESLMNRVNASTNAITSVPTMGIGTKLRMWDTFQESPFAKVMHVVTNRLPGNIIKFDDPAADTRLNEYMNAAKVDPTTANQIRSQLINARDAAGGMGGNAGMQAAVDAAHGAVQNALLDKLGVEDQGLRQAMLDKVAEQTGRNRDFIDRTTNFDGLGKDRMTFPNDAGDMETHGFPMSAEQLKNSEFLPDVGKLETEMRKVTDYADQYKYDPTSPVDVMRQFRAVHPGTNVPVDILNGYQRTWRTLELMRAGVPAKIVGIDALKMVAKIGALPTADLYIGAGADWLKANLISRIPGLPNYEDLIARMQRGDWYAQPQTATVAGQAVERSMGTEFDAQNKFKYDIQSGAAFDKNVGGTESAIEGKIRTGAYEKGIVPGDPTYNNSWEHAVNNQMGRDSMFRKLLNGASDAEVKDWLSTTMTGRKYAQNMFFRSSGDHIDDWIATARDQVDRYLPSEELKTKALSGTATADDLRGVVASDDQMPVVHGEVLKENMAKSTGVKALQDGAYKVRGAIMGKTIDTLVRSKMFDALYTNEIGRLATGEEALMAARGETTVDMDRLADIQNRARQTALQQMNDTLYDLADRRQLAGYLRIASPFFNVWQQNVSKWLNIAAENPAFIARMHMALQAPEKMGLIQDENGNTVTPDADPTKLGTERLLTLPISSWMAKTIPGATTAKNLRFNWKSANVIMQGLPSAGPIVQVPVATLIRSKPELQDSLKMLMPGNLPANSLSALEPGIVQQILGGTDANDTYKNLVTARMKDLEVDYNLGKLAKQPTFQDAENDASAAWSLRMVSKFMSVLPVTTVSPYQKYIDAYRGRQQAESQAPKQGQPGYDPTMDPNSGQYVSPDRWFLNTFGREFFPLTQAVTKSNNGIPSTVDAYQKSTQYRDIIQKYPDLGGLIVGSDGAGKFSQAVYELQKTTGMGPGDTTPQRTDLDPKAALAASNVRQGWLDYQQKMTILDNLLSNAGYANFNVKQAQGLKTLKMLVTQTIAMKNPDWKEAFYTQDATKWQDKIQGMKAIVANDQLAQRPEIQGLKEYLDARDVISKALDSFQKKPTDAPVTINSKKAVAIKHIWDTKVAQLKLNNIPFASLYNRYLSNDPMTDDNKLPSY